MATVTVYNRDGTEYGTLDTSKYVFNNDLIGFEPEKLDINIYPYVKINGVYYVNDGEEFQSVGRADNSAALMSISNAYLFQNDNILDSCVMRLLPNGADTTKANIEFLQTTLKKTGTIDIKNYNIDGKSIQGLCFDQNQVTTAPYRHNDNQPMLPMSNNIHADRFYWDMYPSHSNFFLASNFNQDTSTNEIYKLTTDNEYIYLYSTPVFGTSSNEEVLIGKIRKEWVPYISLAVKSISSSYGTLPVYSYSSAFSAWSQNFEANRLIFNVDHPPANGSSIPLSIHLVGNRADPEYFFTDNPININITQNTSLKFVTMKVYENFNIWLSKEKCNINGTIYEWVDSIFKNNQSLKDLFISKNYNYFICTFKSAYDDSFQWDDSTDNRAIISDLGNTRSNNYPVPKFFGYKIYLKGTDYQIETNSIPFRFYRNQPQHYSFKVDDVKINNSSIKDSAKSGYSWKGCSVNILKWVFSLQGKCGTIGKNLSILSPSGTIDSDAGMAVSLGGFSSVEFLNDEYKEYSDYNYWIAGDYKYEQPWLWEKNSFYSLACAKIGFETPENYGWAILGHSNINISDSASTTITPTLAGYINMGSQKLFTYKVTNLIGYKIRMYIRFDLSTTFTVDVLPFGTKHIDCVVPSSYDKYATAWYNIIQ